MSSRAPSTTPSPPPCHPTSSPRRLLRRGDLSRRVIPRSAAHHWHLANVPRDEESLLFFRFFSTTYQRRFFARRGENANCLWHFARRAQNDRDRSDRFGKIIGLIPPRPGLGYPPLPARGLV